MVKAGRLTRYGDKANAYDVLKFLALISMTLDHVGMYWYHDDLWWRAMGRVAFPVFLFLVGYSRSTSIHKDLLIAAGVCVVLNPLTFQSVFALNALVSIIAVRLLMPLVVRYRLMETQPIILFIACALFLLPCTMVLDYGTLGLLFACIGYMVRQKLMRWPHKLFFGATFGLYIWLQYLWFSFDTQQSNLLLVLMGTLGYLMFMFDHERPVAALWPPLDAVTRFFSRYSLQYYVLHKLVFQIIGAWVFTDAAEKVFRWVS